MSVSEKCVTGLDVSKASLDAAVVPVAQDKRFAVSSLCHGLNSLISL